MKNEYPAINLVVQILKKWRSLLPYILYHFNNLKDEVHLTINS